MKKLAISLTVVSALCLTVAWSAQQDAAPAGVPVTITVSVEAKHGKDIPAVYREDVRVFHDRGRLKVTNWVPLQATQAGLELFLLIDDATDATLGLQFDDLKKFIATQPDTTAIAVGYVRNGTVNVAQNFTKDRALLDKALRLPQGFAAGDASPYIAIHDLIDRWPQSANRREIFLVSSGIDALEPGVNDTYLEQAIERAKRADVQVYSIYASRTGHLGHTMWQAGQGQNNLSRLADATGAEAYFQALEMPISFAPYLNEFADRLKHQYRLTFEAPSEKKAGFQKIRLETEVPNAELVTMDSVFVPAAR
jgi:VWFA-related protein